MEVVATATILDTGSSIENGRWAKSFDVCGGRRNPPSYSWCDPGSLRLRFAALENRIGLRQGDADRLAPGMQPLTEFGGPVGHFPGEVVLLAFFSLVAGSRSRSRSRDEFVTVEFEVVVPGESPWSTAGCERTRPARRKSPSLAKFASPDRKGTFLRLASDAAQGWRPFRRKAQIQQSRLHQGPLPDVVPREFARAR